MMIKKHNLALLVLLWLAPLLTLSAQGVRPSSFGEVDFARWTDNMSVTCCVKQGGEMLTGIEVAAFDAQGNLRGKATADPANGGLIFLMVQGEVESSELHFQMANASGQIFDLVETFPFQMNERIGRADNPFCFTVKTTVRGDVDTNGLLTLRDLTMLIHQLRTNPAQGGPGDLDGNGRLTKLDVMILRELLLGRE